jgi:hypothetical protein
MLRRSLQKSYFYQKLHRNIKSIFAFRNLMRDNCHIENSPIDNESYLPIFHRFATIAAFADFINEAGVFIIDTIDAQLNELIKCRFPALNVQGEEVIPYVNAVLGNVDKLLYGVWVHYPWNGKLVHLLDEDEFAEVRTNRNRNKISEEEQAYLKTKKIGVIGLSVGQSIALTLAMERVCGELHLADFDTIELSNLNRIRAGVHNLGLKKTLVAAREIAEIDPFIKVKLFSEGLNDDTIDAFFSDGGNLDLLIEVCDGLDMKIKSRSVARALRIPVVMDTNDRGMLDIERFDLEPERPILHGLAGDVDVDTLKNLSNSEKIPFVMKIVDYPNLSLKLKESMNEIGKTIGSWPQLASSVVLGGAITTDAVRRILLNEFKKSGRYYVDLEHIIN